MTTTLDGLPLDLDALLHARAVESNRLELKAVWDQQTKPAVVRTVCAFANDLLNLGGGYVVIGVEERGGRPLLPPRGLAETDLDRLQREVRGACERIQPAYQPLVFPVVYQEQPLLVLWVPGGDNRPYQAPEDCTRKGSPVQHYIRRGSETLQARGDTLRQLLESAAKVPFDDRRNLHARLEDVSPSLVRRFLHEVGSDLVAHTPPLDAALLYRHMNLVVRVNGHEVPRNVALLFFNEEPERFFAGARLDVVRFAEDAGGDLLEERAFRGPLPLQIREALAYLESQAGTRVVKLPGQAEAERTAAWPYGALEEALVNAYCHRGYETPPEPIKVYLYSDRLEITSYPGPVPGIRPEHFEPGNSLPQVPARNRRIGDLLRELDLAELRGTGIPKIQRQMRDNGSPPPRFDFDEERTYFRVILPIHPQHRRGRAGKARPLPPGRPLLSFDRDQQKALVRKHVDELVRSDHRRVLALVASASPGNLAELFSEQLLYDLESALGERIDLTWKRLQFPSSREELVHGLESELRRQLEAEDGEPLSHLLLRHVPPSAGRRAVLWLDWGIFGVGHAQAPLLPSQLADWLRFASEILSRGPAELRVVVFAALESSNPAGIVQALEDVRREPWSRRPEFRVIPLEPLGQVAEIDLLDYLANPEASTCPPAIQAEIAERIHRQTDGRFDKTVQLLEEAEIGSWYALLDRLREEQGASPVREETPL
jgi:predicted HTH transcriptional regulator